MHAYSEDTLIEQPTIASFGALRRQTINAVEETLGRESRAEVIFSR